MDPVPLQQSTLPPAQKLLSEAWSFYSSHAYLLLGIMAVPTVLNFVASLPLSGGLLLISGIILLASIVVSYWAWTALLVAITENSQLTNGIAGAYTKGLRVLLPFTWISILNSLTIMGGFLAFFIPGIYLSVALSLSAYVFLAEGKRGFDALAGSWHYVQGYWGGVAWRIFFFVLVVGVLELFVWFVSLFTSNQPAVTQAVTSHQLPLVGQLLRLLVNNFIVLPLGFIYNFFLYNSLRQLKASMPPADETKLKRNVMIFSGLGIVAIIVLIALGGFLVTQLLHRSPSPLPSPGNVSLGASPMMAFVGYAPLSLLLNFWR